MESSDGHRSGLLTAGGILSIVGGIPQMISGGVLIADFLVSYHLGYGLIYRFFLPFFPTRWRWYILWGGDAIPASVNYIPSHWPVLGGCLVVLGIVAVIGGISAIRRNRFGLSLVGAICSLPSVFEGILAVIFVSVSKKEFRAKVKEDGI